LYRKKSRDGVEQEEAKSWVFLEQIKHSRLLCAKEQLFHIQRRATIFLRSSLVINEKLKGHDYVFSCSTHTSGASKTLKHRRAAQACAMQHWKALDESSRLSDSSNLSSQAVRIESFIASRVDLTFIRHRLTPATLNR
jgi:hypothetical protein